MPAPSKAAPEPLLLRNIGADVLAVSQQDMNGDGHPNVTVIDVAFATAHGRIIIYDGDGDMPKSDKWWEATDFTDDTWIFDIGAHETAQLIIEFKVENGHSVAYLWDDVDEDGLVSYEIVDGTPNVTESRYPAMNIESSSDWYMPNGSLNPNLSWTFYGCGKCLMRPHGMRDLLKPRFVRNG